MAPASTSKALALALLAGGASAFVPQTQQAWVAQPTRVQQAATALDMAATQLTRFEKITKKWKGAPRPEVSTDKAGFDYSQFEDLLNEKVYAFQKGDIIKGTVVQYEHQGALVDIGAKSSAFLPLREGALIPATAIDACVDIDESREFQIISEEDENGQLLVSIRRLEFQSAWETVIDMQAEDVAFDGEVLGVNRGGCIVNVQGLRAFLPGSHLCGVLPTEDLIGDTLRLKFLEVNQETNKLVVSNRRAVVEDQMKELARGDVVQGVVKAVKPYGAFVEIAGMSGLLHISQISFDRVEDIGSVIQLNTVIKCMIIDHDKVNGRIALSTKTLEPEPGDMLRDPKRVYEMAEDTAAKYHERMEAERKAREEAAKDIVMGLGGDLDSPFGASSDLEQILNPTAAASVVDSSNEIVGVGAEEAAEPAGE